MIAEKYDVQKLKSLACEHFIRTFAVATELEISEVAEIIEYIYENTPESDRRLRDLVVNLAADRASEFYRCPEFEEMAGRVKDFCNDLAKRLAFNQELWKGGKKPLLPITCAKCRNVFSSFKRGAGGALLCPCCGNVETE